MKTYSFDIFPEPCCELCNETIHNHMECPICGDDYASTDCFGPIGDIFIFDKEISCECGAVFKVIDSESFDPDEWVWKHINVVV